jgi:hypothetical protein
MDRDPLVQDELARRTLAFLRDNAGRWYTVKELVDERIASGSTQEIQKSISGLLKKGLVKVKSMGSELCYQIVSVKK